VPVAPALHQHVEHHAVLVHRTPQRVLAAVDRDDHFIEVSLVASRRSGRPDAPGNAQPKLQRQASHRLVGQIDATGGQQWLCRDKDGGVSEIVTRTTAYITRL
jgi:hypothetical protein